MSNYKPLLKHHAPLVQILDAVTGNAVAQLPMPTRTLKRAADCPPSVLPWLAWERGVDVWRDDWSTEYKRQIINNIGAIKRKKGTHWAIVELFASVGIVATVMRDRAIHAPCAFSVEIPLANNARVIADQANAKIINEIGDLAASCASARDSFDLSMTDEIPVATLQAKVLHTLAHSHADVIHDMTAMPMPKLFFFLLCLPKSLGVNNGC